jgi:hypothetical protein
MLRLSRKYRNGVGDSVAGPHVAYHGRRSAFGSPAMVPRSPTSQISMSDKTVSDKTVSDKAVSDKYVSDEYCRKEHDEKCLRS